MSGDITKKQALDKFLASVERRAYVKAEMTMGNREDALDIVQDAMMTLVSKYSDKSNQEWGPLFNRILHNKMTDLHRKNSVRAKVKGWLGLQKKEDPDDEGSAIEIAPDPTNPDPAKQVSEHNAMAQLVNALQSLPLRQRQAYLLRAVDGCNVAEAASAMGCSEGSIKTHYSRALKALRLKLNEHW